MTSICNSSGSSVLKYVALTDGCQAKETMSCSSKREHNVTLKLNLCISKRTK